MMESKLLDMRDCFNEQFEEIYKNILQIHLLQQPIWIRPFLLKSSYLKRIINFDYWSRAWEYPWAIQAANLDRNPLRILDVGGGSSPFSEYLAQKGHYCFVVDPSLDQGVCQLFSKNKGVYRNIKSFAFFYF